MIKMSLNINWLYFPNIKPITVNGKKIDFKDYYLIKKEEMAMLIGYLKGAGMDINLLDPVIEKSEEE